ncbi:similar to Saccharomyces cerevisiae YGR244C LSC2 Beta subunit of succinyl-CoA ligase [Maudiozyma barnettii]|uniref:Succinate--CoA ligase [ADP-forming] subunit beta, mitochondrial n=1 Tax=Maudiozyma barnettii TaxID=61262 RepID=A0A8H2VI50_9SACH|nr:succinate--CoA ligase (GDP-forming) subunit beta [Kazachstania barnettii]CAB4256121.1 similar to Saccharomyces cerevisiae YGR244C LSC2 Beta subunit of succinyl-CoA ligase [Kazachstania barnettii]CAD1784729.1 similar to Saccharomyces cerevisiae YGR244C LSC2 Beta subunit of succinyl-CoA ligase [Kazachstania barnettii]
MLRNALKVNARAVFKRNLSIHEYRSSQLLGQYGIPHPRGSIAFSPEEAEQVAHDLNVGSVVLKAQALTGGRGKGHFLESGLQGGVKMVTSSDQAEIKKLTLQMLGNHLVTKQSGPKGKFVSGVYVVEKIDAVKESYLSIILDRSTRTPVIVCSSEGGVNIEETAEKNPKAIKKFHVDPTKGLSDIQAHKIAKALGFSSQTEDETAEAVKNLYKIFIERDATQVEINPLSEISGGRVMCMDAKFGFDDNASFRQEEVFSWRDLTQEDPDEVKAKKYDLNFVKLQGNIGCLVNGAGLAMATMDVIKLNGGDPANFLDCGGGATPETIKKAFELILSNEKVHAIFVNIFGGIVRCDHVALGLVNAAKELDVKVPIVARLQGTKLAEGKKIIEQSGISIHSFAELDPAAKKVVELAHAYI